MQVEIRQPNKYDAKSASDQSATVNEAPSLTLQSQAEDADINVIVERFGMGQRMPENPRIPQYGDFTHITDYHSALEAVRQADQGFLELPPDIRERFKNNPQNLLEFAAKPLNNEEMIQLGLADKPPEEIKPTEHPKP